MTTTMSMMQAKAERVGKVGMLASEGMEMPVRVLDVKEAWGNMRFLVEPVGGKGQKWVDAVRVGPAAPAPKVDREALRAELEAATGETYSDEAVELHLECAGEGGVARVVPLPPKCSCDPFKDKHASHRGEHGWLVCSACRGRIG